MKLKSVHCYQYVRFNGRNENFFTASPQKDMADLELELLDGNIISIKTAKDHVMVFPTNVAYCVPMTEENAKKADKSRGQIANITPGTPRR